MRREISEGEKKVLAVIEELGLVVESEFVPFSRSRNKAEKNRSLNWRVSVYRKAPAPNVPERTLIITTDYSAGIAHCPGYKQQFGKVTAYDTEKQRALIEYETENGFAGWYSDNLTQVLRAPGIGKAYILPGAANVISSLVLDSDVLSHATFESWASEFGYDTDSRAAEKTYRACLETALAMHLHLGDEGLAKLAEACSEF